MKTAAAVLLLVASSAFAQVRESITVELIEVPVYVTAPDGTPVRGLTKEAFSLYVNGKPQPIEYFDVLEYGGGKEASAAAPPDELRAPRNDERERRLYLLVFDTYHEGRPGGAVQRAALSMVDRAPATDLFAVATYDLRDGFRLVTDSFLSDRAAIRRAITTFRPDDAPKDYRVGTTRAERMIEVTDSLRGIVGLHPEMRDALSGGEASGDAKKEPARHFAEMQMLNLAAGAEALASVQGQKHVVLLSEGFRPELFDGVAGDARFRNDLAQIAGAFGRAGAMLHVVSTAPLRPRSADDSLRRMAEATGGMLIPSDNDLSESLQRLAARQRVVYLLAFHRSAREGKIEVRVNGAPHGSRLSYRTGFGSPK
jgi:VWFA-related protein